MRKCNVFYEAMLEDLDIRIRENPDFSSETIREMSVDANLDSIAYSLANLADTLEEMNEKLNKETGGGYAVIGDNLRVIRCDAHADDGK